MLKTETYQDAYLNAVRRNRTQVTVFLVNGYQLRGIVTAFDAFVVFLDSEGRQQMIYKHAISTVVAAAPVPLPYGRKEPPDEAR